MRPQGLGELIAVYRAMTLDYEHRENEPGLTSIKQPVIDYRMITLYRQPAGKLDPHRREVEILTNTGHNRRLNILCDQPPQTIAVHAPPPELAAL